MSESDQLLRDAVAHHQAGRLAEAQPIYEAILRADERNANALNLLGMVHHQQSRHDEAAALIARAVALAPAVAGFHNNLGNVRLAQRQHAQAEACYRRALQIQPNYVEAVNNLGVALIGQGKVEEAIPLFTRAIAMKHDYPSARNNLGNALRAKRMYREAIGCYRDAIAFDANHADAWGNLAIALLELGELGEAEAAARRAVALRPDNVAPYFTLGLTLEEAGRREEAKEQIAAALKLRPASRGLRFYLATLTGDEREFAAAPPEFVSMLFDNYADTFDRHLVGTLNYRAPQLLHDAVVAAGAGGGGGGGERSLDIADLGCGTGLCGQLFKPMARSLVGVDLSSRMISQARQRGVYDALHVEELTAFLKVRFTQFDLAVASDVLNYFGDLREVLLAAAQAMRGGGLLAFTLEKHDGGEGGAGYVLNKTRRYAHAIGYVRSLLSPTGWAEVSATEAALRSEGGKDVAGWVVVLRRG
jgi:predicted TPR repeat methyltransferase